MLFTLDSLVFHCQIHAVVFYASEPHPFARCSHVKLHTHNNEEKVFVYTEIHVFQALFVQEGSYEDSVGKRHSTGEYEALSCKNEGKYL